MDSAYRGRTRQFWHAHRQYLAEQGIRGHKLNEYQRWARWYVAAFPAVPLEQRQAGSVTDFLAGTARKTGLSEQEFREIVEAVRQLLHFVKSPLARELDWDELKESARLRQPGPSALPDPAAAGAAMPPWASRLLTEVRARGGSDHTARNHVHWLGQLCQRYSARRPDEITNGEIRRFLKELAVQYGASAYLRNQALSAFVFYFRQVLKRPFELDELIPSCLKQRSPVLLTPYEVERLLATMEGPPALVASLVYGTGMRLEECLRLRVGDIDFDQLQITIRNGEPGGHRTVPLPSTLFGPLKHHLKKVGRIHQADLAKGRGGAPLPKGLQETEGGEGRKWCWQWVFPDSRLTLPSKSAPPFRNHLSKSKVQKALRQAAAAAKIEKEVGGQTLRHSFAAHRLEQGESVHAIKELLGHADIATTLVLAQARTSSGPGAGRGTMLDLVPRKGTGPATPREKAAD